MPRYIDADAALNKLPNDLPYKASVKRVLMSASTADVAEWISVEERLPEEYGRYLCYYQSPYGAGITICGYALDLTKIDDYDFLEKKSGWYKYDSEYGYYETDDITHWMPLPKPPKGGKERDNNEQL